MAERQDDPSLWRAALDAALDAIGAPAFLVDGEGHVELANVAGRARIEADPDGASRRLAGHLAAPEHAAARVLRIDQECGWAIVIDEDDQGATRAHGRLAEVSAQLSLTRRQREILGLVSRGLSNRSIATTLSIAEATVEQHVGTLMLRAGVESRAALIAMLLWR